MTWFVLAVGILGLLIGSLLTVVIWRVPRGESVVSPPPHCPSCETQLRPVDSIPVVSWLRLRGTCRSCGATISPRYPMVELLTGIVFALMAATIGMEWALPAFLYLAGVGLALSVIDLDTGRLPNALTLPSYPVLLGLLAIPAIVDSQWSELLRAVLGGVAMFLFYFVLALIHPRGMGMGDVKFAGVLGIALGWLGWDLVVVGGFLGFLLGAVAGLGLVVFRRAGRRATIPFGPSMYAGAILAIMVGPAIADWYLGLVLGS